MAILAQETKIVLTRKDSMESIQLVVDHYRAYVEGLQVGTDLQQLPHNVHADTLTAMAILQHAKCLVAPSAALRVLP